MKNKISGIYKITNIINNKIYIGQSKDIFLRLRGHKSSLKSNIHFNIHLQRSYNKYGFSNFIFDILEECNEDIINEREKYWINFYNSHNRLYGYNIDFGGDVDVMSDEHKINMSIAKKGTYKINPIDIKIYQDEIKNILKIKNKNEKLVLFTMLVNSKRYYNNDNVFYISYKQISFTTGIKSKNTVIRVVRKLINDGFIKIISSDGIHTNLYMLNINFNIMDNDNFFIIDKDEIKYKKIYSKCILTLLERKEVKELCSDIQYRHILHSA